MFVDGHEKFGVSSLAVSMVDCVPVCLCGDRGLSVDSMFCCRCLVLAEGSGLSVCLQSGQVYLLALANAVCLVSGVWQVQYTPDIPCWVSHSCCFWLGALCPSIQVFVSSVATASLC